MPKSSKTKVLATTLRKFSVNPLGKFKQETLSGDILPEANLVKNIFENVYETCWIASSLLHFIANENIKELDPMIYDCIDRFQKSYRNFSIDNEESIKSFTLSAYDVLLRLRNDKILKNSVLRRFSTTQTPSLELKQSLLDPLKDLMNHYTTIVTTPFTHHLRSVNEAVDNISLKEKYTKICGKLRVELADNLKFREEQSREKNASIDELEICIQKVKDDSYSYIQSIKNQTSINIQAEIDGSEGRINDLKEDIRCLKGELDETTKDHIHIEDELRAYMNRLESEVLSMIDDYDKKMFSLHHEMESIRKTYAIEKDKLNKTLTELKILEAQKVVIEDRITREEEERINQELLNIRRNVAAKVIQRAWRTYKTRQLIKSKKRKGKKRI